jgi:glucose-6-phosphate 1-dehydrogenase
MPPRAQYKRLRRADPCTLVIFGASGDLTQRLLMPTSITWRLPGSCPKVSR